MIDALSIQLEAARRRRICPSAFAIQDVYRFDHRRILAGRGVGNGKSWGQSRFSPRNKIGVVKTIERWSAAPARIMPKPENLPPASR